MHLKKIFSLLVCMALLLSTMIYPLSAGASSDGKLQTAEAEVPTVKASGSGTCGGNLKWEIAWINEVTLTISGTGSMTDYSSSSKAPWYASRNTITKIVIENGATSIGDYAFYGLSKVKSIQMPASITSIGGWAFVNCDSLSSVTLRSKLEKIGDYAFYSCDALESITVDSGNANYSCDMNSVLFNKDKTVLIQYPAGALRSSYTIPDSVKSISSNAFSCLTYLSSVKIGAGVESIENDVFSDSFSLTDITVDAANAHFSSDESGVLFNKNKTALIQYPAGNARASYTIPTGVVDIATSSFLGCENLTALVIPDSVENIQMSAFESCVNLSDVTMSDNIKNVGYDAFMDTPFVNDMSYAVNCGKYYEIYIGNVLLYIVDAGNTSGSYQVTLKDNTSAIAFGAFEYSYASNVVIPSTLKHIGAGAFAYCDTLLTVDVPDSVESVGISAFEYCMNLTQVTLGSGVKEVSYGAFYGCESLDAIVVDSENVNYISDEYGALLSYDGSVLVQYPIGNERTEYTVAEGVEIIDVSAFSGAVNLNSITIPESVTKIGWSAFDVCYNLTDVYYGGNSAKWKEISIDEYNGALLSANITYAKEDPKVSYIKVSAPDKTEYIFGESFSFDGIVVLSVYTDGNEIEVTDYAISVFDPYTFGEQTITVSYDEFTADFTVMVVPSEADGFTQRVQAGQTAGEFKNTYSQQQTYVFDLGGRLMLSDDELIKTGCVVVVVENNVIVESKFIIVDGDGNGDGIVNGKDLIRLKKQILEGDVVKYNEYVDYNGDGILDNKDAEYLTSMI